MSKRSITVAGHRTSISLEDAFWQALAEMADARGRSIAAEVADIDRDRPDDINLSAAIRVAALDWYRRKAAG